MGSAHQKLTLAITAIAMITFVFLFWPNPNLSSGNSASSSQAQVIKLWPDAIPGGKLNVGSEKDMTKSSDDLVAGKRVLRLGNVSEPELHVFQPSAENKNGTSVLVCPGGGFSILAWDLEGTEVAAWLNSLGVTACVLKYRTPTRKEDTPWLMPLQDTQRAMSTMRHHADEWGIAKDRVGILGFSAGAIGATRSGNAQRSYSSTDKIDEQSPNPNFTILVYAGGLIDKDTNELNADIIVNENSPPVFLAHAIDDFVPVENCLRLVEAYKKVEVPAELHLFNKGGHGFGIRKLPKIPATQWTDQCESWMRNNKWIGEFVSSNSELNNSPAIAE